MTRIIYPKLIEWTTRWVEFVCAKSFGVVRPILLTAPILHNRKTSLRHFHTTALTLPSVPLALNIAEVNQMKDPVYEHCWICGEGMETGLIGSESLIFGLQWLSGCKPVIHKHSEELLFLSAETLKARNRKGIVFIRAYRCKTCRIVTFRY